MWILARFSPSLGVDISVDRVFLWRVLPLLAVGLAVYTLFLIDIEVL